MTNKIKKIEKDYEVMKSKIDKLLDQVYDLILDYDEKYESDISNDIDLTIDALKERIDDNACDYGPTDFID